MASVSPQMSQGSTANEHKRNERPSHDTRHSQQGTTVKSGLEVFEQDHTGRPPWLLNRTELKLLGIAGVGFFLDGKLD